MTSQPGSSDQRREGEGARLEIEEASSLVVLHCPGTAMVYLRDYVAPEKWLRFLVGCYG